jgi:hypothetical protein
MGIVNAYELVGSFRGAAELCGTTHKTVKRVIERREVGQAERRVVDGVPTPMRAGQQLHLDLPEVPTRPLSAYATPALTP